MSEWVYITAYFIAAFNLYIAIVYGIGLRKKANRETTVPTERRNG